MSMLRWGRLVLYASIIPGNLAAVSFLLSGASLLSHSLFKIPFTRSAMGFSRGSPFSVMLIFISRDLSFDTYLSQQYWTPRSEWWISSSALSAGSWENAIFRALSAPLASSLLERFQPTIFRE